MSNEIPQSLPDDYRDLGHLIANRLIFPYSRNFFCDLIADLKPRLYSLSNKMNLTFYQIITNLFEMSSNKEKRNIMCFFQNKLTAIHSYCPDDLLKKSLSPFQYLTDNDDKNRLKRR